MRSKAEADDCHHLASRHRVTPLTSALKLGWPCLVLANVGLLRVMISVYVCKRVHVQVHVLSESLLPTLTASFSSSPRTVHAQGSVQGVGRMVHRPTDSRLLANLLSHENDYSQAALASFSAYASASAPPTSQVLIAVAGALSGADDALRNYAAAVERWQEQLKALKTMENDVGNIIRDSEILCVRLSIGVI